MPYCPKCGYEYKLGIEFCPDCGRKLVPKLKDPEKEKTEREAVEFFEPDEEPRLKLLYVTRSTIYANFLKETLEKNKIPCLIKRESMGLVPALVDQSLTDIRVYVREEDFEKSSEIKEQLLDNIP